VSTWSWALEYGPKIETFDLSLCMWKLLALGGHWIIFHAGMSSDDSERSGSQTGLHSFFWPPPQRAKEDDERILDLQDSVPWWHSRCGCVFREAACRMITAQLCWKWKRKETFESLSSLRSLNERLITWPTYGPLFAPLAANTKNTVSTPYWYGSICMTRCI
jgi:hypothetical protein